MTDATNAIQQALSIACKALELPPSGLGTCWRPRAKWPSEPQLKIVFWQAHRPGEDGNFAPACGTINLYGNTSSLFHELGHAIDFQFTGKNAPWSHSAQWMNALHAAPQFRKYAMPAMNAKGRVRLSDLYLSTPHETFARVFECYVIDRAGIAMPSGPDTSSRYSYPQGIERKTLCDAINQHVITKLATEQSPSGRSQP